MTLLSSWLCTNNTKSMFVKIVHPGGHVELHDRPIFASDLLYRNPKCCVTQPTVFLRPWDIVPPDATLMPGEKYYVVPLSTIRKLQLKHSSSNNFPGRENPEMNRGKEKPQNCWLFKNKKSDDDQLQNCSSCLLTVAGIKMKGSPNNNISSDQELVNSSSSTLASSETKSLNKKRNKETVHHNVSSVKLTSLENNWHPNLEIVTEE